MAIKIGIVGLPNVGKSTLFQALTKIEVDTSNYPFATVNPNVGVVPVKDARLQKIAETLKSREIFPDVLEFIDIAGLIEGAHKGEGLGNQFLSHIFNVDIIVEVVRAFKDENVAHTTGKIDPFEDIKIIKKEFSKKDEEILTKWKEKKKNEKPLRQTQDKPQLLSDKPVIYLFNAKEKSSLAKPPKEEPCLFMDIKLEDELKEAEEKEQKEFRNLSSLDDLIKLIIKQMSLLTFFTANENEARSWLVREGTSAHKAALRVHSDFYEKFIRAEIINWEKLVKAGSRPKAREKGLLRTEGKQYQVQEGDVIEFKI